MCNKHILGPEHAFTSGGFQVWGSKQRVKGWNLKLNGMYACFLSIVPGNYVYKSYTIYRTPEVTILHTLYSTHVQSLFGAKTCIYVGWVPDLGFQGTCKRLKLRLNTIACEFIILNDTALSCRTKHFKRVHLWRRNNQLGLEYKRKRETYPNQYVGYTSLTSKPRDNKRDIDPIIRVWIFSYRS